MVYWVKYVFLNNKNKTKFFFLIFQTKAAYVLVYKRRDPVADSVTKIKPTVCATGGSENSTITNGYELSDCNNGQDEMDTST